MISATSDPEETVAWEKTRPRSIGRAQWSAFEGYATEIFTAFGIDLGTPGTRDTPTRFLKALFDATSGYEGDPKMALTY
jgi:GTP cyclohydrolase I